MDEISRGPPIRRRRRIGNAFHEDSRPPNDDKSKKHQLGETVFGGNISI
jgi:hypothetical protein